MVRMKMGGDMLCYAKGKGSGRKGFMAINVSGEETPPTFLPSHHIRAASTNMAAAKGVWQCTQRPAHSVTPGVWLVLNVTHSNDANNATDASPFVLLGNCHALRHTGSHIQYTHCDPGVVREEEKKKRRRGCRGRGRGEGI